MLNLKTMKDISSSIPFVFFCFNKFCSRLFLCSVVENVNNFINRVEQSLCRNS